ncbi:hypothetical protein DSO57_1020122 [Entomophthora muscae]|uniref:Uncharacterized protein n=1 Tax=Entomophthora muscae TaxID=34485 RepID=A0ACC2TEH3_9FUNG|nr:hypothetical protein DSO57_1020122 [Entomophthora muscae]
MNQNPTEQDRHNLLGKIQDVLNSQLLSKSSVTSGPFMVSPLVGVSHGQSSEPTITEPSTITFSMLETLPISSQANSLSTPMAAHFSRSLGLDPTYGQCITQFNPSHSKNSGFQALAYAVFKDENKFRDLKCNMSGVLSRNGQVYQQMYWCNMPKLLLALQTDEDFYPHDCPQLAANTLNRPVACFPFNFPPTLFLPLEPPSSPHADIFPIFLGQNSSGSWVLLEVPRTAPFQWPPICHLHQEVCKSLGIDTHLKDTWRSLTKR